MEYANPIIGMVVMMRNILLEELGKSKGLKAGDKFRLKANERCKIVDGLVGSNLYIYMSC